MKKTFYYTGTVFGLIFCIYLFIMFYMLSTKDENITAFAIFGTIIPLITGIGSFVWLIKFYDYYSTKKIAINQYKLPLILTGVSSIFLIGVIIIFM